VATERFADIITLVDGNEDNSCAIVTPGANLIGHIVANMKGFEKAELVPTSRSIAHPTSRSSVNENSLMPRR